MDDFFLGIIKLFAVNDGFIQPEYNSFVFHVPSFVPSERIVFLHATHEAKSHFFVLIKKKHLQ